MLIPKEGIIYVKLQNLIDYDLLITN